MRTGIFRTRGKASTGGRDQGGRPPMPFIVGAPRSGTTLLRFMLDSHSQMAIPPETGFLTLANGLSGRGDKLRQDFARVLLRSPNIEPLRSDFGLSEEALRRELNKIEPFTLAEGYRAFYRLYANRFGKPRWGDKTPVYAKALNLIREVFPEARFIHLIRDGRDVALSLRRMWFSPGDRVEDQAKYWREFVEAARRDGFGHRDYLEVRYESLILQTEKTLRQICDFIELEFEEGMLSYYTRVPSRLLEHKGRSLPDGTALSQEQRLRQQQRTMQAPDPSCVFAWTREMSAREREGFSSIAGDLLSDLGYQV